MYSSAIFVMPNYTWIFSTKQVTEKLNLKIWISLECLIFCFCSRPQTLEQDSACKSAVTVQCKWASASPCSNISSQGADSAQLEDKLIRRASLSPSLRKAVEQEAWVTQHCASKWQCKSAPDKLTCYLCFTNFSGASKQYLQESFSLALKSTGILSNWTSQVAMFSFQIKAPRGIWLPKQQSSKIQPSATHLSSRIFMTHGHRWILKSLAE